MKNSALRQHITDTTSEGQIKLTYIVFRFSLPNTLQDSCISHTMSVVHCLNSHGKQEARHTCCCSKLFHTEKHRSRKGFSSLPELQIQRSGCYQIRSSHVIADQLFIGPGYPCSPQRLQIQVLVIGIPGNQSKQGCYHKS